MTDTPIYRDTAELQAALDRRGIVVLDRPGCHLIEKTLIIHSDTKLVLAPGVVLKAAPMSRCSLLQNEHFAAGETDRNISVEGGVWDGACCDQGLDALTETDDENRLGYTYDAALFKGKMIRFAHVEALTLEKMVLKDPVSYGIQIASAEHFTARDLVFDYNCMFGTTDGIHVNGPARFGVIENVSGITNDDMVSLTANDEAHAQVSAGPIDSIVIRNVSASNGYAGVRLLSCGDPVTNILVSGVSGTYRHNGVLVSQHNLYPGAPIWFDNIIIEKISASKSATPLADHQFLRWEGRDKIGAMVRDPIIEFYPGVRVGSAVIRDVLRTETSPITDASTILLNEDVQIDRLTIDNVSQTVTTGRYLQLIENHADIKSFRCNP